MRRLNLPFKTVSQNSVGKDSGSSIECISGSTPGLCGGIGWLPVDPVADNVSGFAEKPDGLGKRSSDGPGSLVWGEGGGGDESEPATCIDPAGNCDPVGDSRLGSKKSDSVNGSRLSGVCGLLWSVAVCHHILSVESGLGGGA